MDIVILELIKLCTQCHKRPRYPRRAICGQCHRANQVLQYAKRIASKNRHDEFLKALQATGKDFTTAYRNPMYRAAAECPTQFPKLFDGS